MSGAICNGSPRWWVARNYCPWCDGERVMLRAMLFSGYGSAATCGWCGTEYQDGYLWPLQLSEERRDRNRDRVARALGRRADELVPRGLRLPEAGR
jgi:hypothetical protein